MGHITLKVSLSTNYLGILGDYYKQKTFYISHLGDEAVRAMAVTLRAGREPIIL